MASAAAAAATPEGAAARSCDAGEGRAASRHTTTSAPDTTREPARPGRRVMPVTDSGVEPPDLLPLSLLGREALEALHLQLILLLLHHLLDGADLLELRFDLGQKGITQSRQDTDEPFAWEASNASGTTLVIELRRSHGVVSLIRFAVEPSWPWPRVFSSRGPTWPARCSPPDSSTRLSCRTPADGTPVDRPRRRRRGRRLRAEARPRRRRSTRSRR